MHHQHAAVAGRADGAVDTRNEGLQPFLGAATPMAVPHIAQQERRARRAQIDRPLDDAPVAVAALVERQLTPAGGNAHRTVVQAPDSGASNTASTSAANPANNGDVAASPRANTPCSR